MTTWTQDTKPLEAPWIWSLNGEIWNDGDPNYIELPWQREAPSIWTLNSKPS